MTSVQWSQSGNLTSIQCYYTTFRSYSKIASSICFQICQFGPGPNSMLVIACNFQVLSPLAGNDSLTFFFSFCKNVRHFWRLQTSYFIHTMVSCFILSNLTLTQKWSNINISPHPRPIWAWIADICFILCFHQTRAFSAIIMIFTSKL